MPNVNWQEIVLKFRWQIVFALLGLIFLGGGILLSEESLFGSPKVEVLNTSSETSEELIVEITGAVESPGVYKLSEDSRVEDALVAAGGISANADREWMDKTLNRAAKLTDGQKIYIPETGEASQEETRAGISTTTGLVNINSSSQSQLESLWGIGPVTAQNIIEQRPYSSTEELLTRGIIKKNVFEKIKDQLTVY